YKCDYCKKGRGYGHMVSHAKNRLRRFFLPNLQKLKVLRSGISVQVRFCTRCIKKLKRDGRMGNFQLKKYIEPAAKTVTEVGKTVKVEIKALKTDDTLKKTKKEKEAAKATLNIDAIVGKKV
ncbi:MAG: 50S ribosomal protein L28, partial [Candidatus Marinimicrobia bacterium]|nr:50S ribosomal protein L28 [Candidatus Neomarinimicrobiota bacterium]